MGITASIVTDLAIMFLAARLAAEVFLRLKQPAVVGEILVGAVIGPHALALVGTPDLAFVAAFAGEEEAHRALEGIYRVISDIGAIVLLFVVGLNTRARDLMRMGRRTASVAIVEVAMSFGLAFAVVAFALRQPTLTALFVAAAVVATSIGIAARILSDLGQLQTPEARVVLGAAVLDDLLGLLVVAAVSGVARRGDVDAPGIAAIAAQAIAFTVLAGVAGPLLVGRFADRMEHLRVPNAPFVVALVVCFGLAALSAKLGLGVIIGAFFAGMAFADVWERFDFLGHSAGVYELVVPFFFVITGTLADWRLFLDPGAVGVAAVVIALAIGGKVVGAGLGAIGMGWRRVAVIGISMVPRGEVSLIAASAGIAAGAISESLFTAVVMMAMVTTLLAPPALAALYPRERAGGS